MAAADSLRIQVLFAAIDRLTAPLRKMGAGSRGLKRDLAETRKELKDLQKAQGSSNAFRKAQADLDTLKTKVRDVRLEHEAYRTELANVEKVTAAQTRKLEKLASAEQRAGAEVKSQSEKVERLGRDLRDAGVDVAKLGEHEERLANDIREANVRLIQQKDALERNAKAHERVQRAQELGSKFRDAGAKSIAAGSAMAAPLILAGTSAAAFESKLTDIGQKADLSREKVAAMGREFDVMGPKVAQLPIALAEGVDALMGLGLGEKQAMQAIRPIATAASAYKAEITDLAAATFASHDNLKVPAQQTGKTLDIMAKAGKAGAFEIKDMAQYFPALTASANALGHKGVGAVADLAAALQITRKGAGDSASAAGNLQNLLDKINTEDTIKHFKKFGIDVPAAMKKAAREGKSPIEAITELTAKATGGDLSKLSFLFGDAQVQAALRPLVQNIGLYRQIRSDALKAQGDVEADFNVRMKDAASKWERMKASAQSFAHVVGGALLPALGPIMDRISGIAERTTAWAQANPALVQKLAQVAAIMAAVLVGVGALAIGLGTIVGPFAMLRFGVGQALPLFKSAVPVFGMLRGAAMFLAKGVMRAGLMMLANPVVLVIVAIVAALGLAGYLIYKHWDTIKAAFASAWDWISTKVGQFKDFFLRFPALFGPIGLAVAFVVNNWDKIKAAFRAGVEYLLALPGRMANFGANIIQGLINGIKGKLGALKSTVTGAASSAASWFKEKLGIRSPSRVFMAFGGHITEGLARGIDAGGGNALRRISNLSTRVSRAFSGTSPILSPRIDLVDDIGRALGLAETLQERFRVAGDTFAASILRGLAIATPAIGLAGAAQAAPYAVTPLRPPVGAAPSSLAGAAAAQAAGVTITGPITIELTQAPGEDGASLARRLAVELEKLKAGRSRASYADE
jgi:TP901 family phage tail tape measure protein